MGFKAPAGSGSNAYEDPEVTNHPARCIGVIDLGTKDNTYLGETKKKREMILLFELHEKMQDGKPFVSNWWNTLSLAPGSNLTANLESWRGAKFGSDGEREAFELSKLLGQPCMVSLTKSTKGNISVAKHGIAPLMKGFDLDAQANPSMDFGIDDIGGPAFDTLYPWLQNQVMKSDEGQAYLAANPGFEYGKKPSTDTPADSTIGGPVLDPLDDIPF